MSETLNETGAETASRHQFFYRYHHQNYHSSVFRLAGSGSIAELALSLEAQRFHPERITDEIFKKSRFRQGEIATGTDLVQLEGKDVYVGVAGTTISLPDQTKGKQTVYVSVRLGGAAASAAKVKIGAHMNEFPGFFQEYSETALRKQVAWLSQHVGVDNEFFSKVIQVDQQSFSEWRERRSPLSEEKRAVLGDLWKAFLRLLSFLNFDSQKVRSLIDYIPPTDSKDTQIGLRTPWSGMTIKVFLERHGAAAIAELVGWVTSFRFGDRYSR